ncbi:MAG: TonB-dependent receptor [Flavobacteriales bacterium]
MPSHTLSAALQRGAVILFLLFLAAAVPYAQRPPNGGPPIGRLYGKVIDDATNTPAEYATVTVRRVLDDSIVGGSIAKANGDFMVEGLRPGRFKVTVSFIGYSSLVQELALSREQPEKDLGNLRIQPDATVLKDAKVTGEKNRMQLQVDRRVYNVDKDIAARGGNATDVMKNIPGLSVDVEGNVTMRSSAPQILVDGRPSLLQMEQIPAEEIDRIEVITNPGVAFDANSTGGIVNVVLKKSTKPGYTGQLQAGIGTSGRYSSGGNLQVKEGAFTFNLSGNGNLNDNTTDQRSNRKDFANGETISAFDQSGESATKRLMYNGRFGVDYAITNRNTIMLSAGLNSRGFNTTERQSFANTDGLGLTTSNGTQTNEQENDGYNVSGSLGFKRKSPKQGKEWTADLNWNLSDRNSDSRYARYGYDAAGALLPENPVLQHNTGGTEGQQWTFQFDAQDPRNDSTRFEYGFKSSMKQEDNRIGVFFDSAGVEVPDTALSSDQKVTDIVNAIYFNWQHKLSEHWTVQAGLRVEQTWFEAERNGNPSVSIHYPDGGNDLLKAIFPAIYLSRKWDNTRELQFNVSRKINRPNHWQVMPFVMFSDSRSFRIGNPSLGPELMEIGELNHLLPFGERHTWLTSVFAKHTSDVITSFVYTSPSDSTILISTFVNGDDSWTYGWENTVKWEPLKGTQFTLSGTVQYVEVGLGDGAYSNSGWVPNGKVALNQKLPKQWGMQINAEYEGERPIPQGEQLEQWGVDAAVSKDFGKQWSTSLSVNDIFFTRRWGTRYETADFTQESWRRREQRFLRLNITWRFGQQDASLFRRKGQQQRNEPGNGGEGEGF